MKTDLSYHQERLWFIETVEAGSCHQSSPLYFNIPVLLNPDRAIRPDLVEQSVQMILQRHEVLRTNIIEENGNGYQVVNQQASFSLEIIETKSLSESERVEKAIAHAKTPFAMDRDTLVRGTLIQSESEEAELLLFVFHHIAFDHASIALFLKELEQNYNALLENREPNPDEVSLQYTLFSEWQRGLSQEDIKPFCQFWKNKVGQVNEYIQLPRYADRTTVNLFQEKRDAFVLNETLTQKIVLFADNKPEQIRAFLLALFKMLLYRYSGQSNLIIGTTLSGRKEQDLNNLIGPFDNPAILRDQVDADLSFDAFHKQVATTCDEANQWGDVAFERVVQELKMDKELGSSALFDVLFHYDHTPLQSIQLGNAKATYVETNLGFGKYDINLRLHRDEKQIVGKIVYNGNYLKEEVIKRLFRHYENLVEAVLENPNKALKDYTFLDPVETEKLIFELNRTEADFPKEKTIAHLIKEQIDKNPENTALIYKESSISYAELGRECEKIAQSLRNNHGLCPNDLAVVMVDRSPEAIFLILGVLLAGGAYVPVDPAYPEERIDYILNDCQAKFVLAADEYADTITVPKKSQLIRYSNIADKEGKSGSDIAVCNQPGDLAYMIYTSGTTGYPKGCLVTHQNVVRLMINEQFPFQFGESDVWTLAHSLCFDFSVWEMFGALFYGGTLVIPDKNEIRDGKQFLQLVKRHRVSVLNQTPGAFYNFIRQDAAESERSLNEHLRYVIFGGDKLKPTNLQSWIDHYPTDQIHLVNMYGITETTVHVTWHYLNDEEIRDLNSPSIIGVPIPETTVYICDEHMNLLPEGIPGEMLVGGTGVTNGYLNWQNMTDARFVPDPFSGKGKLYRSGDLGRWNEKGQLEYLERIDQQVKIRGYRIEKGEIESVLRQYEQVEDALVTVAQQDENKLLVAYIQQKSEENREENTLKEEQVKKWKQLYEETYANPETSDSTFNISGWNNSYTQKAYSSNAMREWLDATVDSILSYRPEKVLEIGCGTGMLLFQMASKLKGYHGIDLSKQAVNLIQEALDNDRERYAHIAVEEKPATELDGFSVDQFDMVLMNSVIQYFPGIDYLHQVIEQCIDLFADSGKIYIGDVRNYRQLELFHTEIARHQLPADRTAKEVRQFIDQNINLESELLVDPRFFEALAGQFPQISRVEVLHKQGSEKTEMNDYRYDVILHIGTPKTTPAVESFHWSNDEFSLEKVNDHLKNQPQALLLQAVPNERVLSTWNTRNRLLSTKVDIPFRQIQENDPDSAGTDSVSLQQLSRIAGEGYTVRLLHNAAGEAESLDVLYIRDEYAANGTDSENPKQEIPKSWKSFANEPLKSEASQLFIDRVREYLKERLPTYMIPGWIFKLDSFPLTTNGKINIEALPTIQEQFQLQTSYTPPATGVEEKMVAIWENQLGIHRIGIHDNFFDIGGHSLKAVGVLAKIKQEFDIDLPYSQFFQEPTIKRLSELIG